MDRLRIILLILGIILIAGIYFWETRRRRPKPFDDDDDFNTSYLDDLGSSRSRKDVGYVREDLPSYDDDIGEAYADYQADESFDDQDYQTELPLEEMPRITAARAEDAAELSGLEFIVPGAGKRGSGGSHTAPEGPGLLVAFTVMAEPREPFAGTAVQEALSDLGFSFGDMQIFHYYCDTSLPPAAPLYSAANVLKPGTFDLRTIEEVHTPGVALFMQTSGASGGVETFDAMLEAGTSLASRLGGELRDEGRNAVTKQSINHLRERIVEFGRQQRLKASR